MFGKNFPVTDYYKDNIMDAVTISRSGSWWSAVLLVKDPQTEKPIILLYQWQKKGGQWKTNKRFSFKKKKLLEDAIEAIKGFSEKME